LKKAEFIVVQDSFMSETAEMANLVLPASFWFETGGSFTNSNHMVQSFREGLTPKVEQTTVDQLLALLKQFNINGCKDVYDVQTEILSLLPQTDGQAKYSFVLTSSDSGYMNFVSSCNHIMMQFDREFETKLEHSKTNQYERV